MPELPEVETIARGLAKRVTGDVIESVWLGQKKEPLKSPASEIAAALEQTRIATVRRIGKHIVFDLVQHNVTRPPSPAKSHSSKKKPKKSTASLPTESGTAQWIVHLGMTGRLQVCAACVCAGGSTSRQMSLPHQPPLRGVSSG